MKKIRIGIFGAGRGGNLAQSFILQNAQIVALCESNADRMRKGLKKLPKGVATYDNFDEFIKHPMDAVILANSFHQHAKYAIKCFERNLHVYSECLANGTMAEGVALVRAFEKSKSIYMLAENYPQMLFNREMKRVADGGTLGKIVYVEGEYNHPVSKWDTDFTQTYKFYDKHWRHYLPATYYVTHSLGPCMRLSGATPTKVTAFATYAPNYEDVPNASHSGADAAAIITTLNDNGSVFRVTGCASFGSHHNSYRVCGTKGQIENLRGMDGQIMLHYNKWDVPEGMEIKQLYMPQWNDKDEELIKQSGHDGADFITARIFLESVMEGKQPPHPFDVYSATCMSSVAMLAHRSVLEGGRTYDVPDFRKEEDRLLYENDNLSPFYGEDGSEPTLPCCSHPDYKPTEKQMELYYKELEKKI